MPTDDDRAELLRQFDAAISGSELNDLRQLAGDFGGFGDPFAAPEPRPDLRRPARTDRVVYRIRVDLDHASPPIWRRLDLRSDLHLDAVHQVLQVAFAWTDSHLHQFSLGGGPFDRTSQLFLCPFDVEEGEAEGVPTTEVRLDEVMCNAGDVLRYVYDFGDNWGHTLRLEEIRPAGPDTPAARVVDGQRAAPAEDSGGVTSLQEMPEGPTRIDLDELNETLASPYFQLHQSGLDPRLIAISDRLIHTPLGDDLARRLAMVITEPIEPEPTAMAEALQAFRWFLTRARDGFDLTAAGYLKPVDVKAASAVVPAMGNWIGAHDREANAKPLLKFRKSLQAMGLLRKHKGRLLLTRLGQAIEPNLPRLWEHLSLGLVPDYPDQFEIECDLLILAYAGSSGGTSIPLDQVADALTLLGWRHEGGRAIASYELFRSPVLDVLGNVSAEPMELAMRAAVSPAAAALARAALRPPAFT